MSNNPIEIFKENREKARALKDANAHYCSLATVSNTGQVSIRTLVLREVTENNFFIFINGTSPKWRDLWHSEQFELLVFWPSLMQQYRIRGRCEELSADTMKSSWLNKPYQSKMLDHFYRDYQPQSSEIESREAITRGIDALKQQYPDDADIPFPENAKGMAISASSIEVWHGAAADRLHDRCLYVLKDGVWEQRVLVP